MLAQPPKDEGEVSERLSETQPTPSPTHPSEDQSEPQPDPFLGPSSSNPIPDSIPKGSGGNYGGQSSSDRSLSGNEDGLTLQSVYDLCVSLCTQVTTQAAQIKELKAQIKQLKKKAKPVISHHNAWIKSVSMKKDWQGRMHKDLAFDDLDNAMDYMETEDAHDEGTVKDSEEIRVSTEDQVSTDKPNEGTAEPNEDTAEPKDRNSDESAAPTTVFKNGETIAQFLIDPKDKGKKVLEEKIELDAKLEGVNKAEKKFKMLANDEEIAREVQEEWEAEEEKKKLAEEEATKAAFTNEYDFIQARLNADKILTKKLQEEERENFTIEQRAKFLHDTIAVQRRFLTQQRSEAIKNKLPTRNQLRNQMMTYLKYVGSAKDEKLIKKINEKAAGMDKEEVSKEPESTKVKAKIEEPKEISGIRSVKRLKIKPKESWIFYENYKVHVLRLKDGTEINMLAERRYPLTKITLERMMDLRLTVVSDDDTIFDLLRFIEQQIDEFGGQDGSEKDL
ncbi:hypothetical protein Tco_1319826 [Tanacetum coccineum]